MRILTHSFKMSRFIWLPALFLIATAAAPQTPARSVRKRVSPDAYGRVPAAIRAALKEQHFELPETQHWDETQLNIVQGRFGDAVQSDWAAICIAPAGSTQPPAFSPNPDPSPVHVP